MTFRDSEKVVGTLRVPSATLVTAHGVCLLLCAPHDREMSFRMSHQGGFGTNVSLSVSVRVRGGNRVQQVLHERFVTKAKEDRVNHYRMTVRSI